MIERKFWKPSITSQLILCPIPYHIDTYRGCVYDCTYCFARDFVTHTRSVRDEPARKTFSYLEGNRPELFKKWIERTMSTTINDYSKANEVAFRERIPLKIGATSDPFPPVEFKEHITYDFLKVLNEYDYPVEIQTKNPAILVEYLDELMLETRSDPNWTVAVTIISMDHDFVRVCEPRAPSPIERMQAIKTLASRGIPVMVKCQPAIYPKIMDDLPGLVKSAYDAGCWAMLIQGLKVRMAMPRPEQEILQRIGTYLGISNFRKYYQSGEKVDENYEISRASRLEYCNLASRLCHEHGMKFFNSDKYLCQGDGVECCGTEKLRDYKIWSGSYRNFIFGKSDKASAELGKCYYNFVRRGRKRTDTINDAVSGFRLQERLF